ncbi:MAG: hypothetical protein HWE10_08600 [Gammaproteobacteria bacterium]|nr:hypothetical protein [Gammaproteobacteria bacterium]
MTQSNQHREPAELVAPPKTVTKFLHWALPEALREPVLGDLYEEFQQQSVTNPKRAKRWYRKQAIRSALQFLWKTKRGLFMFLISILVFIGFTLMGMMMGGDIPMFIDVPSILLVAPPAIAFAIGATSWKSFKMSFGLLIDDENESTSQHLNSAVVMFKVLGNSAVLCGVFATLIGAVAIASNLEPENFSEHFGPAFAVCILTLLYGFMIKTICYVAEQKLEYKKGLLEEQ